MAITLQNIKTELHEIKSIRLSSDVCSRYMIRSRVLIFGTGQPGKETEITTWKIRFSKSKTKQIFHHTEYPPVIFN